MRCDRFDGFPCLTDGKADAHVRLRAPRARSTPTSRCAPTRRSSGWRPTRRGRSVKRVVVDRARHARSPTALTSSSSSCGAINSAALLLRSASDEHPSGLANSSDVVGRHYMAHLNSGVIAISQTPNDTRFQKTLGLNDYYWGAEDSELPLGHIQMLGKSDGTSCGAARPGSRPGSRSTTSRGTRSTSG